MATNDRPTSPRPTPPPPPRRVGWLATALAFIVAAGCQTEDLSEGIEVHRANISGANISGANISGANISGANISGANISGANISGANISGANISGANISGANISGANISGANISGANISGANISGANISGANISGANTSAANGGFNLDGLSVRKAPSSSLLYSGQDLLRVADRCVVMGMGSTAFATFLGHQGPTSTLHAAIGKLPWGFTTRADGRIESSAWEVAVQGDRSRCSFVLATSTTTRWSGVAGFVKAIFRWNAPSDQSMVLRGIPASARYDTSVGGEVAHHTGMMDAAARWRAAQIDDKSYVAGELAFVAATTNNRSVMVDFASWVTDVRGSGLILGNVDSGKPPTHAESVYYVFDNGDGTLGLAVGPASWVPDQGRYSDRLASTYESLDAAYQLYQTGIFPKPIPTRCGGALFLKARHGETVAAGKCDDTLVWAVGSATGYRPWESDSGTTAPMNHYMLLPADASTPLKRNGKIVLSETYVHMWDPGYEYGTEAPSAETLDKRNALTGVGESALDLPTHPTLQQMSASSR